MIIDRNKTRRVSEDEEEWARTIITHVLHSSGGLLHFPDSHESEEPMCQHTLGRPRRDEIESWPTGYRDMCSKCVDILQQRVDTEQD